MRLHWVLWPWAEVRRQRRINGTLELGRIALMRGNAELRQDVTRLEAQLRSMQNRIKMLMAPKEPLGATTEPEFVMTGVNRGVIGKRIYASRTPDLGKVSFGQSPMDAGPTVWTLDCAGMGNMLVIDAPDYQRALDRLMHIWANWDANAKVLAAGTGGSGGSQAPVWRQPVTEMPGEITAYGAGGSSGGRKELEQ